MRPDQEFRERSGECWEYRDQIRVLGLDRDRMTVLDDGGMVHNVTVEVGDAPDSPLRGTESEREPVLVTLSPERARELASQLWWLADRSVRIGAGR